MGDVHPVAPNPTDPMVGTLTNSRGAQHQGCRLGNPKKHIWSSETSKHRIRQKKMVPSLDLTYLGEKKQDFLAALMLWPNLQAWGCVCVCVCVCVFFFGASFPFVLVFAGFKKNKQGNLGRKLGYLWKTSCKERNMQEAKTSPPQLGNMLRALHFPGHVLHPRLVI